MEENLCSEEATALVTQDQPAPESGEETITSVNAEITDIESRISHMQNAINAHCAPLLQEIARLKAEGITTNESGEAEAKRAEADATRMFKWIAMRTHPDRHPDQPELHEIYQIALDLRNKNQVEPLRQLYQAIATQTVTSLLSRAGIQTMTLQALKSRLSALKESSDWHMLQHFERSDVGRDIVLVQNYNMFMSKLQAMRLQYTQMQNARREMLNKVQH